jgi:hypothetical protein
MARAIALQINEESYAGDSVIMAAYVTFIGTDLPGPDASIVRFTIGPTDGLAIIRDKLTAAIDTEADRLGYNLTSRLIPGYQRV